MEREYGDIKVYFYYFKLWFVFLEKKILEFGK